MSYLVIAFLNLGAIPGRFLLGFAHRVGRFDMMVLTSLVCAILTLALCLSASDNLTATICYAVLFGFWSGAAMSLTRVCISRVCATEDYGKRNRATFTIVSLIPLLAYRFQGRLRSWMKGNTES